MKRREFMTLLGGAAAMSSGPWPLAARAQQPAMPVVGFLHPTTPEPSAVFLAAFRKGLSEMGYVEGRNVAIEYRWANNDNARLPELAADLVRRRVAVIVTPGSTPAVLAAKALTTTIPIVFSTASDPVQFGLVASFNRPGGNVTGFNTMNVELGAKRFGLLHELIPGEARFAMLLDPTNSAAELHITVAQTAAATIGRQIEFLNASTNREIDAAFASLAQKRIDALLVPNTPVLVNRRVQIATLAVRYAVPAMYASREFADIGGLMSYGTSATDQYRQTGIYTGRILKGEKPADLPVQRPVRFEFVINLQTARTLGIEVPAVLLAIADEVIE
jgi:putative ABC transport system substrate-binding protein